MKLKRVLQSTNSRSREGARIEIANYNLGEGVTAVAPARERGLKFDIDFYNLLNHFVAPARERGLKSAVCRASDRPAQSLPRGSED